MGHGEEHTLGKRIGAIVLGLAIMGAASWLYLWSEGQRTGTTNTLNEILVSYEDVSRVQNIASQDLPFAYVQGKAESEDDLVDELFQLTVRGVFFNRNVLQLKRQVEHRGMEGGPKIVSYEWSLGGEHPLSHAVQTPSLLKVAGVAVSSQMLDWPIEGEVIRCGDERIGAIPEYKGQTLKCRSDGEFTNREEGKTYEEGDIRVSFTYYPLDEISLIGRLSDGVLYPVEDQSEKFLYLFESGKKSVEQLVESARARANKSDNIGWWYSFAIFLLGLFFFTALFRNRRKG